MISSCEGSQNTNFDDSNKPVEQFERSADHLQFAISYYWRIPCILFLKYLIIKPTRLLPVNWDYNRRRSIIDLYYLLHTNTNLNSIKAEQPGFEPGSNQMMSLANSSLTTLICNESYAKISGVYCFTLKTLFFKN